MVYNLKKIFGRKSLTFLLIISIVSSTFYLPAFAPKTEAFWGIGDTTWDVPDYLDKIIDGASMVLAQQLIDNMVSSTVKWAQSGFEGNPAYATDPKQFFTNIADGVAGEFIMGSDLGFLCSPFQANIRLSLTSQYYEPEPFQCTLTDVVGNIEGFYDDFSQGGWDGWFSMTQNPTNNPYGAYLAAKIELDSRIAEKIGLESQQLDWNQGFISWSDCVMEDPLTGECLARGPVKTPGSTIKAQLDKVLPTGLEKLVTAQHIEQLVSSFASGLLTRYVFGSKGLFASNTGTRPGTSSNNVDSRLGNIDLDNDTISDGRDSDYDGRLATATTDVCYHGGTIPNCVRSSTITTSPYFTPVCQAITQTIQTLKEFTTFLDSHADQIEGGSSLAGQIIGQVLLGPVGIIFARFLGGGSADNFRNPADAEIWANRLTEVDASVGEVLTNIQTYHSPYFDNLEIATNRFSHYTGNVLESLTKDADLDLTGLSRPFSSGGGGLANLMKHSAYNLRYFQEAKTRIGRCESPNISVINEIPLPPVVEPPPTAPNCPVPTTPTSLCEDVDRDTVLAIVNNYPPTNEGIEEAIVEVNGVYPDAEIIPHPLRLDKIDFGGGMIVDVISCAGGDPGVCEPAWTWIEECECGGEPTTPPSPSPPPPPQPTPTPPPGGGGPQNEFATVQQVAAGSSEWNACQAGNEVACHRFIREVASTLATRDSAWGLLTKSSGENQCTMTACGNNVTGGYGGDVIAYLRASNQVVYIYDLVGGAGAPNASLTWNGPLPRRSGNNWAPVPSTGPATPPPNAPASLLPDVEAERARYGSAMTADEMGRMLNTVAWNNRAAGWGLSRKDTGAFCPSPVGLIACDILHHQPSNTLYRVLSSTNSPSWVNVAHHNSSSRPWVAPVQP